MIAIAADPQIGANTHSQLQEMTPVSFKAMNKTHRAPKNPIPLLEDEDVVSLIIMF